MLACLIFKDLLLERAVGMSEVCVELVGKLVGEMLGLSKEELSPSDNLISLGLGSLDIMRIAGLLTKNGCNVTFSELVSNPCMASWVTSGEMAYIVKSADSYELTAAVACYAIESFLAGSIPNGVYNLPDLLDPELAIYGILSLSKSARIEIAPSKSLFEVEEGEL